MKYSKKQIIKDIQAIIDGINRGEFKTQWGINCELSKLKGDIQMSVAHKKSKLGFTGQGETKPPQGVKEKPTGNAGGQHNEMPNINTYINK